MLYFGEVPASFLTSRTTLIPKSKIPASAGDYRPISVTSIICRLYHKLISRSVELALRLHHSQRAFRAVDDVAANLTVLDCVVSDAKTRYRDVNISFVDLRKAFDSVSHASLLAELGTVGFPSILLRHLRHYYAHGTSPSVSTPWAYLKEYGRETLCHRSFLTHWWTERCPDPVELTLATC